MKKQLRTLLGGANLPLVSILLFFIALLPGEACAKSYTGESGVVLTYSVSGDEVTITGMTTAPSDGNLVIPSEIEGKPVTKIKENAFYYESKLVSVKFPASVTTIELYAFSSCSSLTQVSFDENSKLTTIERSAFYMTSITEITIPESVTLIEDCAFASNNALTKVTFLSDNPTKSSSSQMFSDWSSKYPISLKVINVPKGTKEAFSTLFSTIPEIVSLIQETEDTPSGIHATTSTPSSATHAAIYSIDGKLVSKEGSTAGLAKGIYIQNGKKMVIGK